MDMEFELLINKMDDFVINTTAAREHVGDIERMIRTVKELCCSVVSKLPYKDCMPDQFIIHLIYFVMMWINAFPADNGVSENFSPHKIVAGLKMDYTKHCKGHW